MYGLPPSGGSPYMKKYTTTAIDLAKHSFQVCKLHGSSDEFNKAFTRDKIKA